jgi:hypothetical protein
MMGADLDRRQDHRAEYEHVSFPKSQTPSGLQVRRARLETGMAKKQKAANGFVLFDVLYEDGTRTSNRKVPASELGGLDGDAPARVFVERQDRAVGQLSGVPRGRIKTIARSAKQAS